MAAVLELRAPGLTPEQQSRLTYLRTRIFDMWETASTRGTGFVDTDGYLKQVRKLREVAEDQYDSNAWRAALLGLKREEEENVEGFKKADTSAASMRRAWRTTYAI